MLGNVCNIIIKLIFMDLQNNTVRSYNCSFSIRNPTEMYLNSYILNTRNKTNNFKMHMKKITFSRGSTRKAPPPAASVTIAIYLGFTVQNVESHELLVMRILS